MVIGALVCSILGIELGTSEVLDTSLFLLYFSVFNILKNS